MPQVHFMVKGRIPVGRKFACKLETFTTDHRRAKVEFKQLVNSLAETGLVNQIEDRESPFNGMLVDYIVVCRPGDDVELDNLEWVEDDE